MTTGIEEAARRVREREVVLAGDPSAEELAALLAEHDALEAAVRAEQRVVRSAIQDLERLTAFRNRLRMVPTAGHQLDQIG